MTTNTTTTTATTTATKKEDEIKEVSAAIDGQFDDAEDDEDDFEIPPKKVVASPPPLPPPILTKPKPVITTPSNNAYNSLSKNSVSSSPSRTGLPSYINMPNHPLSYTTTTTTTTTNAGPAHPHPLQQQQQHFHHQRSLSMPTTQPSNNFALHSAMAADANANGMTMFNRAYNDNLMLSQSQQQFPPPPPPPPLPQQQIRPQQYIYVPCKFDVLFGRGGAVNTHTGNVFFRSLVNDCHPEYIRAKNHAEKAIVVKKILNAVMKKNGRFLRRATSECGGGFKVWYVVDERDATVKTMQTLRDVKGCDGFKWNSGNPCGHQTAASMKLYPTDVNWKTEQDDNDDLQKTTEGTTDTPVSSEQATDSTESSLPPPLTASSSLSSSGSSCLKRPLVKTEEQSSPLVSNITTATTAPAPAPISTAISSEIHQQAFKRIKHDLFNQQRVLSCQPPPSSMTSSLNSSMIAMSITKPPPPPPPPPPHPQPPLLREASIPLFQQIHPMARNNTNTMDPAQQYQAVTTAQLRPEDVLSGRGGGTNRHPGNVNFRAIVAQNQPIYSRSRKRNKSLIAKNIVRRIRHGGGRFLKLNDTTGLWFDVGDKKATEKASQALREGLAGGITTTGLPNSSSSLDDGTKKSDEESTEREEDTTTVTASDTEDSAKEKGTNVLNDTDPSCEAKEQQQQTLPNDDQKQAQTPPKPAEKQVPTPPKPTEEELLDVPAVLASMKFQTTETNNEQPHHLSALACQ